MPTGWRVAGGRWRLHYFSSRPPGGKLFLTVRGWSDSLPPSLCCPLFLSSQDQQALPAFLEALSLYREGDSETEGRGETLFVPQVCQAALTHPAGRRERVERLEDIFESLLIVLHLPLPQQPLGDLERADHLKSLQLEKGGLSRKTQRSRARSEGPQEPVWTPASPSFSAHVGGPYFRGAQPI